MNTENNNINHSKTTTPSYSSERKKGILKARIMAKKKIDNVSVFCLLWHLNEMKIITTLWLVEIFQF